MRILLLRRRRAKNDHRGPIRRAVSFADAPPAVKRSAFADAQRFSSDLFAAPACKSLRQPAFTLTNRMSRDRIDIAVRRIESALARIESAAGDTERHAPEPSLVEPDEGLLIRHEALRQSVRASLAELDALIGALEK
ncbi:MAG: hypothetical protein WCY92_05780 [Novosphingobium sp.]